MPAQQSAANEALQAAENAVLQLATSNGAALNHEPEAEQPANVLGVIQRADPPPAAGILASHALSPQQSDDTSGSSYQPSAECSSPASPKTPPEIAEPAARQPKDIEVQQGSLEVTSSALSFPAESGRSHGQDRQSVENKSCQGMGIHALRLSPPPQSQTSTQCILAGPLISEVLPETPVSGLVEAAQKKPIGELLFGC